MDPNTTQPQVGDDALKKLEEDLKNLEAQHPEVAQEKTPISPEITPPEPPTIKNEGIEKQSEYHEVPKQKSSFGSLIALILVLLGLVAIGLWVYKNYYTPTTISCTTEAKVCPDGTSVGREGPNCEFAECPEVVETPTSAEDLKTYSNPTLGVEFKYPSDWLIDDKNQKVFAPGEEGFSLVVYGRSIPLNNTVCWNLIPSTTQNNLRIQKRISVVVNDVNNVCWGTGMGDSTNMLISKTSDGNDSYRAVYEYSKSQEDKAIEIFNQIVSTFKFIEATPSATPN